MGSEIGPGVELVGKGQGQRDVGVKVYEVPRVVTDPAADSAR